MKRILSLTAVLVICLWASEAMTQEYIIPFRRRAAAAGGPPTIRGIGTFKTGTAAQTLDFVSGTAVGDMLLAFCHTQNQAITITDWTEVGQSSNNDRITVFYRIYTGTENLITSDSGLENSCITMTITGGTFNATTPFPDTPVGSTGTGTTFSVTGLTTTVANSLYFAVVSGNVPDAFAEPAAEFSGWTNASLASITESIDLTTSTSNGGSIGVASGVKVAAGAVNATTGSNATGSNSKSHLAFALAAP